MLYKRYQVYVVLGRSQREYSDTQAALDHVPAKIHAVLHPPT